MQKSRFAAALGFILLTPTQVLALPTSYPYPAVSSITAERDLPCYMHTAQSVTLNLSIFCTTSPANFSERSNFRPSAYKESYSNTNGIPSGTYSTVNGSIVDGSVSGGSGGSSGPCDYAEQRDSRGRRCGGRAANRRSGGR